MAHYHDVITELREPTRELRHVIPEAWAAFSELHQRAVAPGRVAVHMKELIALAIAVSKECDGCIAYHARAAAAKGATREELAEVLGVTLRMGGGPATIYAPRARAAFDEFTADTAATS
jgi:AhpD family alkylhydroperoxidase